MLGEVVGKDVSGVVVERDPVRNVTWSFFRKKSLRLTLISH